MAQGQCPHNVCKYTRTVIIHWQRGQSFPRTCVLPVTYIPHPDLLMKVTKVKSVSQGHTAAMVSGTDPFTLSLSARIRERPCEGIVRGRASASQELNQSAP